MKTAIVYASVHHKNTEKVVKAIAEKHPEIELIDATKTVLKDLASFDLIGLDKNSQIRVSSAYRFYHKPRRGGKKMAGTDVPADGFHSIS